MSMGGLISHPTVVAQMLALLWSINDRLGHGPGRDVAWVDENDLYADQIDILNRSKPKE